MNTAFDTTARLLDALRAHRAKLSVEVVDLRKRLADLDRTISKAERLLAQHQPFARRSAA
jgi:hypothetical protein